MLQAIRNHPRTRDLAVVVLTCSQQDNALNACAALGVNNYVVKPLSFEQLIALARQMGLYWMLLKRPSLPLP